MKYARAIISFILLAVLLASCKDKEDKQEGKEDSQISVNYYQPFTLYLNSNDELKMQKNEQGFKFDSNKMILFTFFTDACTPCEVQNGYLKSFASKYKDNLRVIGVVLEDHDKNSIKGLANKLNIDFELSYGDNNYFFAKAANSELSGIPFSILYDKNGNFLRSYDGLTPPEMMESDIKRGL